MAWTKSHGDWFPDDCTPPQRHRYMRKDAVATTRKPHSAKALPGGELIAVLPRVGDRWAAVIKFTNSGRVCVSEFTYPTYRRAMVAAWDFWTPAADEPARRWRDEFGQLPPRRQQRSKTSATMKDSKP
jgi:hypothetical protein